MMENKKILAIHIKKDTGKYAQYYIIPLSKDCTREEILKRAEEFNANEKNDTAVKLYEDDLLVEFADDARGSIKRMHVIDSVRSICSDIESCIRNLEDWQEDIEEILKLNTEEQKND